MLRLAFALILASGPALAQSTDHSAHAGHTMAAPSDIPYAAALAEANATLHRDMNLPLTGNADVDFVAGMLPHHQGAVEMAQIVLEHGTDPEVRKLAEAIIAAQQTEIAWMKDWLAKNQ